MTRTADNYKLGVNALGLNLNMASWSKGQITLNNERSNDMFQGEDEDFDGQNEG